MSKQIQPPIDGSSFEGISRVLDNTSNGRLTGTEIAKILKKLISLILIQPILKWKRLR